MPAWNVAAVLLDMDGTLIDTEKVYLESTIAALAACGYTDGVAALCHRMIGLPGPECDRMLRAHFGADYPAEDVERLYRIKCAELLADGLPLKPGVIELLDAIEASGLRKALVTAAARHTADEHLLLAGIAHRFDAVLTRDDVVRSKPSPDLYLLAAERLCLQPQACVAVEDSNPGVASAHAAGAITIMVPDILPPTEETRARCAAVLPDLDAVLALLRQRQVLTSA
jgi:HAD superfamily hydrolase (TIGR01509 family)